MMSQLTKKIVITGGPGAGKTAVLELAKRKLCEHVLVLPEAASILFAGGFWRRDTIACKKGIQRAIFHVQTQLESIADEENVATALLCDRGSLDGLAYWPDSQDSFWEKTGSTKALELAKYHAIIHLRTPSVHRGYEQNLIRKETFHEASQIDRLIEEAWAGHPRRFFVESHENFLAKVIRTFELIEAEIPRCCQCHE
jgi:predicted ATPase